MSTFWVSYLKFKNNSFQFNYRNESNQTKTINLFMFLPNLKYLKHLKSSENSPNCETFTKLRLNSEAILETAQENPRITLHFIKWFGKSFMIWTICILLCKFKVKDGWFGT